MGFFLYIENVSWYKNKARIAKQKAVKKRGVGKIDGEFEQTGVKLEKVLLG